MNVIEFLFPRVISSRLIFWWSWLRPRVHRSSEDVVELHSQERITCASTSLRPWVYQQEPVASVPIWNQMIFDDQSKIRLSVMGSIHLNELLTSPGNMFNPISRLALVGALRRNSSSVEECASRSTNLVSISLVNSHEQVTRKYRCLVLVVRGFE